MLVGALCKIFYPNEDELAFLRFKVRCATVDRTEQQVVASTLTPFLFQTMVSAGGILLHLAAADHF